MLRTLGSGDDRVVREEIPTSEKQENRYEYLGFGTPCSDKIIRVPNDFFKAELAKAGTWTQIENIDEFNALIDKAEQISIGRIWQFPGGSSSNVAKVYGRFTHAAAYFCKLGDHPENHRYINAMQSIEVQLIRQPTIKQMSQVVALIDEETGERIFRVYPTLSHDLSPDLLTREQFEGVKIVQFEGFMVKEYTHEFIKKAMELAQEAGAVVVLDLGCEPLVENYREVFFDLLENVDILFANQEEARILSQTTTNKEAGEMLSCSLSKEEQVIDLSLAHRIAVIKQGSEGATVFIGGEEFSSLAFPIDRVEDTDGAGDFFAGSFLVAFRKQCSMLACLQAANRVGGAVVAEIGAEIPEEKWNAIIEDIEFIIQEDLGKNQVAASNYVEMAKTARKVALLEA